MLGEETSSSAYFGTVPSGPLNMTGVIELGRFTEPVETAGDAHVDHFVVLGERCPQMLGRRGTRKVADKHRWTAADARRKDRGRSGRCGDRPHTPVAAT